MWFYNLLTSVSDSSSNAGGNSWRVWVIFGVGILAIMRMSYFNTRAQKKRQKEMQDTLQSIKPGNKVKTIGGICGVVVEVNTEDNTFVLETGNEKDGKSYIRFDMVAIYQTDAKKEEAPVQSVAAPTEEAFEEVQAPAEEVEIPEFEEGVPADPVDAMEEAKEE